MILGSLQTAHPQTVKGFLQLTKLRSGRGQANADTLQTIIPGVRYLLCRYISINTQIYRCYRCVQKEQ